jgi:GTP cyclohydrolase II
VALVFKNAEQDECPVVRIHSECLTGDAFSSLKCDCGQQLEESLKMFGSQGGILLYLRQEGRDIGLYNKIDAYLLQSKGHDTFEANLMLNLPEDNRKFQMAAEMLLALGVQKIQLLSNNPDKVAQLESFGIEVKGRQGTGTYLTPENKGYLSTKHKKAKHIFDPKFIKLLS